MLAVIQARYSSRRLPGKIMKKVGQRPLLSILVDRLRQQLPMQIVVATSIEISDDVVEELCRTLDVYCVRGSLTNVAERLILAATTFDASQIVRISADSPLLDPKIVQAVVSLHTESKADLTTNVFPRSYPKGQSVEVFSADALGEVVSKFSPSEKEHVTQYFYNSTRNLRIENLYNPLGDQSQFQLSVDTPDDLRRIRMLVKMEGPHASYERYVERLRTIQ